MRVRGIRRVRQRVAREAAGRGKGKILTLPFRCIASVNFTGAIQNLVHHRSRRRVTEMKHISAVQSLVLDS